jgi:hypothetical protein
LKAIAEFVENSMVGLRKRDDADRVPIAANLELAAIG